MAEGYHRLTGHGAAWYGFRQSRRVLMTCIASSLSAKMDHISEDLDCCEIFSTGDIA